jgi:SprT protein
MTPEQLHGYVTVAADDWWNKLRALYPSIAATRPEVKYNKRLKTTAGRAFIESKPQYIDLSTELLWQHPEKFMVDTIPHELAHCAAYTVYGDTGHGKGWKLVMRSIGLEPERCHTMVNVIHQNRKTAK